MSINQTQGNYKCLLFRIVIVVLCIGKTCVVLIYFGGIIMCCQFSFCHGFGLVLLMPNRSFIASEHSTFNLCFCKTGLSSIEWSVCLLCGKSSSFIADLACATKVDGPHLGPVAVRILWRCWMCRGAVVPPGGASVLRCPWLAPSCPCSHWRRRCGALWQAPACCGGVGCDAGHTIVMVWLHPASATTPFGELLLAPLLISLMHSS